MNKASGNEKKDGLETVLEVPIPEEICTEIYLKRNSWSHNMKHWMKSQLHKAPVPLFGCRRTDVQLLLGVMGSPLVPVPVAIGRDPLLQFCINNNPIEASSAQYIVQQYVAATGGSKALSSVKNVYAMGKVRMVASEFETANKKVRTRYPSKAGEVGCFVLWQMTPDKWCMELLLGGIKLCAGSDGNLVWRQSPWLGSRASTGPARPLRRSLQGLDPRTTASLFCNARCIGEKRIGEEECFVLKLSAEASALNAGSRGCVEIIRHNIVGYFSQKTGLLVRLEDSHLLRIQPTGSEDAVYCETKMESTMEDYRVVDGIISIAHGGRSVLTLFKFGESAMSHTRTKMEEYWAIQEAAFNVQGLSTDCFLPPADLKDGALSEACELVVEGRSGNVSVVPNGRSRVAALETFDGCIM